MTVHQLPQKGGVFLLLAICLPLLSLFVASRSEAQTIPPGTPSVYLPLIAKFVPTATPTATNTPLPTATQTPTPTATSTPEPTPTLHPLNPALENVALRPYDVPPGYSVDRDEFDGEAPEIQYAGGYWSWYRGDTIGFGSTVYKYWTPDAAFAGYERIIEYNFNTDFYDSCTWGTRAAPAAPGAATYSAIQCQISNYDRTIYLAVYENIVLEFEFAAPYRATNIALACEKMMAQRALGQAEDFSCRTLLAAISRNSTKQELMPETMRAGPSVAR